MDTCGGLTKKPCWAVTLEFLTDLMAKAGETFGLVVTKAKQVKRHLNELLSVLLSELRR